MRSVAVLCKANGLFDADGGTVVGVGSPRIADNCRPAEFGVKSGGADSSAANRGVNTVFNDFVEGRSTPIVCAVFVIEGDD